MSSASCRKADFVQVDKFLFADHTGAVAVELARERPLIGCEGGPSTCGPPHFLPPKGNGASTGA